MPDTKDRKEYLAKHSQPLGEWREYLSLFLSAFFEDTEDYWDGGPARAIDKFVPDSDNSGEVYQIAGEWRNWTFEIRAETPVPTALVRRVYVDREVSRSITKLAPRFPDVAVVIPRLAPHSNNPLATAEGQAKVLAIGKP